VAYSRVYFIFTSMSPIRHRHGYYLHYVNFGSTCNYNLNNLQKITTNPSMPASVHCLDLSLVRMSLVSVHRRSLMYLRVLKR